MLGYCMRASLTTIVKDKVGLHPILLCFLDAYDQWRYPRVRYIIPERSI